jgi:hypothetical protein
VERDSTASTTTGVEWIFSRLDSAGASTTMIATSGTVATAKALSVPRASRAAPRSSPVASDREISREMAICSAPAGMRMIVSSPSRAANEP